MDFWHNTLTALYIWVNPGNHPFDTFISWKEGHPACKCSCFDKSNSGKTDWL